jgi:hypothetical protein
METQTIRELPAFERQLLLARVYHFSWYSDEAYAELLKYINKWEDECKVKAVLAQHEEHTEEEKEAMKEIIGNIKTIHND